MTYDEIRAWLGTQLTTIPGKTLSEVVVDLEAVTALAADLAIVKADLQARQQALLDGQRIPRGGLAVEGADGKIRTVKAPPAPRPKYDWDNGELLDAVVAVAADRRRMDPATGEALEREGEAVARTIAEVWPLTGDKARVTVLRDLGIDPDEYRARRPVAA